jgi:small subunit ribosomal protein S9|uniref:Small ribosomal subunit protein uS9c n=2 Tax=Palmaria TaxID=2821 RepID=A0A6C0W5E6_PALDE|nr:30S ribosomal protein S9 [Palmaria decipiens]QIC19515.1 30S ribosomal protein S9 [Palmaria decipiens]BBI37216.1 30S ribosomal protein S9 [Palmaria palmata]
MTITSEKAKTVYTGTGRRKESIARVRLVPGSGKLTINNLPGEFYLQFSPNYIRITYGPLKTLGLSQEYDILVNTHGGGLTGQADAIRLGVARALCSVSPDNRGALKAEGHLTRDARVKERRKYGLRKARKAPQFSKR